MTRQSVISPMRSTNGRTWLALMSLSAWTTSSSACRKNPLLTSGVPWNSTLQARMPMKRWRYITWLRIIFKERRNSTAKSPTSTPTSPRPCLRLDTSIWILQRVWPIGALGLYPDSPWGHRFLGDMLLERDRWEDAAQEYKKALAIDPRQSGLHTLLGESYLHGGKVGGRRS